MTPRRPPRCAASCVRGAPDDAPRPVEDGMRGVALASDLDDRSGPARWPRIGGQPGVQLDVVAHIAVAELGPFESFEPEPGRGGDAAGGLVVTAVAEFEPEQAEPAEGPLRHRRRRHRGHTLPAGAG